MHKEIIINALVSLFIACISYLYLDSAGILDFAGGFIKQAKIAGGFASFAVTYFLIDKSYSRLINRKSMIRGNVSDETGKGINGALIYIQGTSNQVSSNNVGFFSITADTKKGHWVVNAEHDDYEAGSSTVNKGKLDNVAITLKKKFH